MMADDPLSQLRRYQILLLEMPGNIPANDCSKQFHPDLSPLDWHLGHCVFTETFWLREVVMDLEKISDTHKQLYIPELSKKVARSSALPSHAELCEWAAHTQQTNIDYLGELIETGGAADLMQDNYLLFFLTQHYAQHIETCNYILAQRNLQADTDFKVGSPLNAASPGHEYRELERGSYSIGAADRRRHYDNECPGFSVELDTFQIATTAVSNAEFLGFMQDGGYQTASYWGDKAWQWRTQNAINCPQHWRLDEAGNYYGTDANGAYTLLNDAPVSGLSHFEANALASWAKARLPHEYEWEAAKKKGVLLKCGQVWEWCQNSLHPYAGFEVFPYAGYSLPWFDQGHFSLRGHSQYTLPVIQRDTFRNFYEADKRHFPAGLRLATS